MFLQFHVDDEFQKLWRSIAVDSLDDMKIEEYLEKTGFAFMQVSYRFIFNHVVKLIISFSSDVKDSSDILDFVLIFYILG